MNEPEFMEVQKILKEVYKGERYWYDPELINKTIKAVKEVNKNCNLQNFSGLLFDFWVHIRGGMNETPKKEIEQGIADFLANYNH